MAVPSSLDINGIRAKFRSWCLWLILPFLNSVKVKVRFWSLPSSISMAHTNDPQSNLFPMFGNVFCEQILNDIFSRLPVKSLLRIKCVCKAWQKFIEGSDFIKFHLNRSIETNSNRCLIFTNLYNKLYAAQDIHSFSPLTKLSLPEMPRDFMNDIIGTCNGLILIRYHDKNLAFCNPSTRTFKRVPSSVEVPIKGPYGLGYDSECDDYKIVKLLEDDVVVYSMKADAWSKYQVKPPVVARNGAYYFGSQHGTFLNNYLHWFCSEKRLHSFDIHHNTWGRVMTLPDCVKNVDNWKIRMGVFDGFLHLSIYRTLRAGEDEYSFETWVMKEYGVEESWTKVFSFAGGNGFPLLYSKTQEAIFSKVYGAGLFGYYSRQNTTDENVEVEHFPGWRASSCSEIILCMESLVALIGGYKLRGKEISSSMRKMIML